MPFCPKFFFVCKYVSKKYIRRWKIIIIIINEIEKRREGREGRTVIHSDDTCHIPFWEISVELKGKIKHYKRDIKRRVQKVKKYMKVISIQKYVYKKRIERGKEWKRERDVLVSMMVTLDTSHFERSLLNKSASRNTIQREKRYQKKCAYKWNRLE